MQEITYLEAIRQALWEEMEKDERVFLLGEDIGVYGGAFKITKGFLEKFGEDRVIDTPLSESGFVGAAIGAALMGMWPVVEMQFADFISCAFDQIVNMAAKYHYRLGSPVPMVIRAPYGGRLHAGPYHSQCPEAWFIHSPGLKVVAPATPYDAKGLLKASIRDPNPVIYCEHKYLYRHAKGQVPVEDYVLPLGQAEVKRDGTDITLITYGAMVQEGLQAVEQMSQQGVEVELVDLRTLYPMDTDTILASVKKTGKVLILHEAPQVCGVGAEIGAIIAQEAFHHLDAPLQRLTAPHTPVPFSAPLEDYYLPNAAKIVAALSDLASY